MTSIGGWVQAVGDKETGSGDTADGGAHCSCCQGERTANMVREGVACRMEWPGGECGESSVKVWERRIV